MANRERGEAEISLGGRRFVWKLGAGALIAVQEKLSTPDRLVSVPDIIADAGRGRLLYIRTILWGALQRHHPTVTETDLDDLLDAASMDEVKRLLETLAGQAMPDPRDVQELAPDDGGARPFATVTPVNGSTPGTGADSTSTLDASASPPMPSGS